MAVDAERVWALCEAWYSGDPDAAGAAMETLRGLVRADPAGHIESMIEQCRRVPTAGAPPMYYDAVVEALRDVDEPSWRRLLDRLPTEPSLWDPIQASCSDPEQTREVVDHLGIGTVSRAWHDYERDGSESGWWAVSLVMNLGEWADEQRHRGLLEALIGDADDETIVDVGCGPLEDFVSDDADRLYWLAEQCARNDRTREALRCVWCSDRVTLATLYRLDELAGEPLRRIFGDGPEFDIVGQAAAKVEAIAGPDWTWDDDRSPETTSRHRPIRGSSTHRRTAPRLTEPSLSQHPVAGGLGHLCGGQWAEISGRGRARRLVELVAKPDQDSLKIRSRRT